MHLSERLKYVGAIGIVLIVSAFVSAVPFLITGIPASYRQSSDATVHVVDWRISSPGYRGQFAQDVMFNNYPAEPTGVIITNHVLADIAYRLHIDPLDWSVIIEYVALFAFLSGVYVLTWKLLANRLLAFVIALVSIIPVISLGLGSWGFVASGFIPHEPSLAIAVWLTVLYVQGLRTNSWKKKALFFFLLGASANWYPVLPFHYAAVLFGAEILLHRGIRKELLLYGAVFLLSAPVALFDIFVRAANFSEPDTAIILDHYTQTLHSVFYLLVHYLRKQFIYIALIGALGYIYRRTLRRPFTPIFKWIFAVWLSSLVLSLLGVGIELFSPQYMKYLIARTSVWFYFTSMLMIASMAYDLWFARRQYSRMNAFLLGSALAVVFLAQSSLLNIYTGIRNFAAQAEDYRHYVAVVSRLNSIVPPPATVVANPDGEALTLRVYGDVTSYVSWKDGNVTLFDGNAARQWFSRYQDSRAVFQTRDFNKIAQFARTHGIAFYLYDLRDIDKGKDLMQKSAVITSGNYGLVSFGQ